MDITRDALSLRQTSAGKAFSRSMTAAREAISTSANRLTACRKPSWSSSTAVPRSLP